MSDVSRLNSATMNAGNWPLGRSNRRFCLKKFHAVFRQASLNLCYMGAIAGFHGAKDVDSGKIRPGESPVMHDLRHIRSRIGQHGR